VTRQRRAGAVERRGAVHAHIATGRARPELAHAAHARGARPAVHRRQVADVAPAKVVGLGALLLNGHAAEAAPEVQAHAALLAGCNVLGALVAVYTPEKVTRRRHVWERSRLLRRRVILDGIVASGAPARPLTLNPSAGVPTGNFHSRVTDTGALLAVQACRFVLSITTNAVIHVWLACSMSRAEASTQSDSQPVAS